MNDIAKLQSEADRIDQLHLRVRYHIETEGPFIGRPTISIYGLGEDDSLTRRDIESAIIGAYRVHMDRSVVDHIPWAALHIRFVSPNLSESFQNKLCSMLASSDDSEEIVLLEAYAPHIVIESDGRNPLGPQLHDVLRLYPGEKTFIVDQPLDDFDLNPLEVKSIMTYMRPNCDVYFKFSLRCAQFDALVIANALKALDAMMIHYRTNQFLRPRDAREHERFLWLIAETPGGQSTKAQEVLTKFALSRGYNYATRYGNPFGR